MRLTRVAPPLALGMALAGNCACSVSDLTSGLLKGDEEGANGSPGPIDTGVDIVDRGPADAASVDASGEAGGGDATADVTWNASSWPDPGGAVRLQNALTAKYLNAPLPPLDASSFTPGVPVVTWGYTGATNQCWTFQHMREDDSYEIFTDTGRCLDDPYGNADSGTTLQQYQCWIGSNGNQNDNQRWYLVNNQGHLQIVGKVSGKCLASTSSHDGANAYIWDCSNSESEQWILSSCQ